MERNAVIDLFARLGGALAGFGGDERSRQAIGHAMRDNPWFTRGDIVRAVEAVRAEMLDPTALGRWLAPYPAARKPRNVGVVMAGNIPLVGFFDLLCVLAAGHACLYKPSSKDAALIDHVVALLREIAPDMPVYLYIGQPLNAVIATGSDNTKRLMGERFRGIAMLLRGSRGSVAVLDGGESDAELDALADDIFAYSGLGCRSVSHLLLPEGYDTGRLIGVFDRRGAPSRGYANNFVHRRAVLRMQGAEFAEGAHYLLREEADFPANISEITYSFCADVRQAGAWLAANDARVQCVVGRDVDHPRAVPFGHAHRPALTDYPDGVDTMRFLEGV
jgi:hypothetical protein